MAGHSIMRLSIRAALVFCMLAAGDRVLAQTTAIPQAPTAPSSSPIGAVQGSVGRVDLRDTTGEGRAPFVTAVPWATDQFSLSKGWSFRFESPASCARCPDGVGPPITNANVLWQTSGAIDWQVGAGHFGGRVTGQRGARLPLYMSTAATVPTASDVNMSDPRTQWVLTLSAERAVLAYPDRTVRLFGDLYLPLGSVGWAPKKVDVPTLPQRALVGGVRIRSK